MYLNKYVYFVTSEKLNNFIPNGAILSSLKIGWNALIIPAMAIQLYYLYKNNYISKSDLGTFKK